MIRSLPLLVSVSILASCGPSPDTAFDAPFPRRNKNLWWELGNEFTLLEKGDTIRYSLEFIRDGRKSLFLNETLGDTAFFGTVSKHQGLYYFSERINDSTFYIHAVDIDNGLFTSTPTITGFATGAEQMKILEERIENGEDQDLIKSRDTNRIVLKRDPNKLYGAYSSILDSISPDTLIELPEGSEIHDEEPGKATVSKKTDTSFMENGTSSGRKRNEDLIERLYPNPVAGHQVQLEMRELGEWRYRIFDVSGGIRIEGEFDGKVEKVQVRGLDQGTYVLQVYSTDKENEVDRIRIVVGN